MLNELTIIAPVFNEEESLIRFRDEMNQYLDLSNIRTEVLFVNDGSVDKSLSIIQMICDNDDRYSYLSFDTNYGLSTAIKAGIDYVNTRWVGYIDTDLQTSPMDFLHYYEFLESYSMINGIRAHRNDRFIKKMSSKVANGFRRLLINDGIADTCCPLKIIETDYAQRIPFFKGMHRFIPALIQLYGGKVKQVEVQHFPRIEGVAKYNLWNRMIGPFFDTLAFAWMKKRVIKYSIKQKKYEKETVDL